MGAHEWTCAPGFPSVVTDLDRDPAERHNRIDAPESQPLRREVERELAGASEPDAVRRSALDGQHGLTVIEAARRRRGWR